MNIPWEAIVAVVIYIIGSTIGFIWWMATITITMQFMKESLEKMTKAIEKADAIYATKVEMTEKFTAVNLSLDKAWLKIDHLTDK